MRRQQAAVGRVERIEKEVERLLDNRMKGRTGITSPEQKSFEIG